MLEYTPTRLLLLYVQPQQCLIARYKMAYNLYDAISSPIFSPLILNKTSHEISTNKWTKITVYFYLCKLQQF